VPSQRVGGPRDADDVIAFVNNDDVVRVGDHLEKLNVHGRTIRVARSSRMMRARMQPAAHLRTPTAARIREKGVFMEDESPRAAMRNRGRRTLYKLAQSMTWDPERTRFERLAGGLAHESYVAHVGGERYVVKFLSDGFVKYGLMLPHDQLIHNTRAAGEAGVGARLVRAIPEESIMVLEFIEGRTLEMADLADPYYVPRIAGGLRQLHTLAPPFANEKTVFDLLDGCLGILGNDGIRVPRGCVDHLPTVERIRRALEAQALRFVPCNNDAYAPNFIDQNGTIRIIDYDYSGMNDPCFELGNVAVEGRYTPNQIEMLSDAYFEVRRPVQVARTRLFGIAAQFTWTLLFAAADQVYEPKPDPDYDYWAESLVRWRVTLPLLTSPELGILLDHAQRAE
jgi:thiamine kinase-like enzyme